MSLARKFHKRARVATDTGSKASTADNPVPSVEKEKGYPEVNYTPINPRDYNDNEFCYETPSPNTPPLKVPPYVPDQPVNHIPDFSDSDEEAEFAAKVEAYYQTMEAEKGKKESVRLTAPKRKITELLSDDDVSDDDVSNDEKVDVKEEEEQQEDGDEAEEDEEGEEVPIARSEMINNLVDLLEMTGVTLNFVVKLRGVDIDPTDPKKVREALNEYLENENKPLETSVEDAPEHAAAMIERLFDMPLREFLPLAYDIAEFRDDLEAQGISLNQG
ncbi:hypothetical protein F4813DRAFT_386501 [Daldinia decipiens]|uniref:uncharacterized protein n=1 Tax=Daldinia decipiens TaxID=326647 RepID=UPI0020C4B526|nr:uncharacterized protein F4813DRAFT_386501 [Daldinia decipiens]KAI1661095.1 hypothetical protein F4813DRAFT_386501 [Daldinia decipiens]